MNLICSDSNGTSRDNEGYHVCTTIGRPSSMTIDLIGKMFSYSYRKNDEFQY